MKSRLMIKSEVSESVASKVISCSVVFVLFFLLSVIDQFIFGIWQEGFWGAIRHYTARAICQGVINSMFWLSFCFFFGRKARFVLVPAFWGIVGFELIQLLSSLKFGTFLGGEWLILLMTSSMIEMRNFLSILLSPVIVAAMIVAVVIGGFVFCFTLRGLAKLDFPRVSMLGVVLGLLMILPLSVLNRTTDFTHTSQDCRYVWFVKDTMMKYRFYMEMEDCKHQDLPVGVAFDSGCGATNVVGVVVIGESASRNHWSLYGYPRKTTPCMDGLRDELFVFTDVRAASIYTVDAVRYFLTGSTIDNSRIGYTLSGVCKAAGYNVIAATAQGHWGRMQNWEQLVMGPADQFISIHDLGLKKPYYDRDLLPFVFKAMDAAHTNRTLALVHLMGSHMKFRNQCPDTCRLFEPDYVDSCNADFSAAIRENINDYDNTIHFTDRVLGDIVEYLKKRHQPAFMIYVSDHGETPSTGIVRYYKNKNIWEIPTVIWLSPEYEKAYPDLVKRIGECLDRPYQLDQLLHGVIGLCGCVWPDSEISDCFYSADFKIRKVRPILKGEAFYLPEGERSE